MVLGFQCIQMGLSQGATPRCDARSCGRGCGCWFLVLGCWAGGRILADSDHACECETSMLRGAQVHALVQVLKRLSSAPGECPLGSCGSQATFARCAALCLRAPGMDSNGFGMDSNGFGMDSNGFGMDSAWIRRLLRPSRCVQALSSSMMRGACKRASPPPGWRADACAAACVCVCAATRKFSKENMFCSV